MTGRIIQPAYSTWVDLNDQLTARVGGLDEAELGLSCGPDRWPLWAVVGHAACQRVFWLCDFAGEPGAGTTRFTNAAWNCPGDDDLENVLTAQELVDSLTSTFAIVDRVLNVWTFDNLAEQISRPDRGDDRVLTRGEILQRVFAHDLWHAAEVNEILTSHGLDAVDPWN